MSKTIILLDENQECFVNRQKEGLTIIGEPLKYFTLKAILDKLYGWLSMSAEGLETEIEVDSQLPYDGQAKMTAGEKLVDILRGKGLRVSEVKCE